MEVVLVIVLVVGALALLGAGMLWLFELIGRSHLFRSLFQSKKALLVIETIGALVLAGAVLAIGLEPPSGVSRLSRVTGIIWEQLGPVWWQAFWAAVAVSTLVWVLRLIYSGHVRGG